jgi:propionate CoA-transferase
LDIAKQGRDGLVDGVTAEREALTLDNLAIPGALVDCVVLAEPEHHMQTYATAYNPAYSAEIEVPLESLKPMPLEVRKVIARRCAMELPPGGVVNLGIGMPEGAAAVAAEERILDHIIVTAEPGVIGGVPASGLDSGTAVNTHAIIHQNQQFDFYDGGGLDMACLGMAECDPKGNVNVSRFGSKLAGAGGFINISQSARKVVFAGTFSAGGLEVEVEEAGLRILQDGRSRKFRERVHQVTFSGEVAASSGKPVLYVTERCVFRLRPEGIELVEVAPGVDIERDILAQIGFKPLVRSPKAMDGRLFRPEPMDLRDRLLDLDLSEQIANDPERNILFLNFEGLQVQRLKDVEDIREAVGARCRDVGKRGRGRGQL